MIEESEKAAMRPDYIMEEIVRYWWQRRMYIITTMLALIVFFIIILLLIPERYRANATAIVMPPRFLPEARTAPLSVNTARNLLETGEITQKTLERLQSGHTALITHFGSPEPSTESLAAVAELSPEELASTLSISEELAEYLSQLQVSELQGLLSFDSEELAELTADDLAESLESEETIEKRTVSDVIYSPLLQLTAIADSGSKAQVMANTWAEVFASQYESIARVRTERQFESLQKQQTASQQELEELQATMVAFQARNNLDLFQREIDQYSDSLRQFSQQLSQKHHSLARQEGRLEQLVLLIRSMEDNGTWIGKLPLLPDGSVHTTGMLELNMQSSTDTATLSRIRLETAESRRQLMLAIMEINNFHTDNPVHLIEQEVGQLQRDYLAASSRLQENTLRRDVLRATLAGLDERIAQTSQVLEMSTSVPNETIGDTLATNPNADLTELSRVQFRNELLNPVWELAIEQRETTEYELATVENDVKELEKALPQKERQLRDLQNRYYNIKLAEDLLAEQLERWKGNNEQLFNNYVDMQSDLIDAAQEVSLLSKEVEALETATSDTRARVEQTQQKFDEASAELELLDLRQAAVQRNADLLMQKMQEAQIAVREDISDVSLATRAIAPNEHFFPQRSLFLVIMTAVSGITLLLWLGRKRYQELRDGRPALS